MNEHRTLRRFLGHSDVWDEHRYKYQTLVDNVSLRRPELLVEVNQLLEESGHAVAKKILVRPCAGGVTRSWLRPMCTTPRMSVCCGTRCVA